MTDSKLPPDNDRSIVLQIGGDERKIDLDPTKLLFNETSINEFQERLAIWYDYFGEMFCQAERNQLQLEHDHEVAYAIVYGAKKEEGCTEKQSEAYAKCHPDVVAAKKKVIDAKTKVKQLEKHVRSWDRAHDNAQSRGHMIRREMDKLNSDIYFKNRDLASRVEEIVGK